MTQDRRNNLLISQISTNQINNKIGPQFCFKNLSNTTPEFLPWFCFGVFRFLLWLVDFFFFFFLDILDIFVILVHHIKHLSLVLRAYEHTFRQKVLWAFLLH